MYDLASSILQQKISQVDGVGQVVVGGGALPAVRVEVNPTALHAYGLGLEDVRTFLAGANANRPKGELANDGRAWSLASPISCSRPASISRSCSGIGTAPRCVSRTSRT